jgi:hypothetical protein
MFNSKPNIDAEMAILHRRVSLCVLALDDQRSWLEQEKEILNWISPAQKERRDAQSSESPVGRCGWFFNNDTYKDWATASPASSGYVLVCRGQGKTLVLERD